MTISKGFLASAVLAMGVLCAAPAYAQRGGGHAVARAGVPVRTPGPAPTLGHAVPRPPYSPAHYPGYPYHPYYPYYPYYRPYYYGPGIGFGVGFYYGYPGFSFGVGFGYPYYGYGYPYYGYPYYGAYPYGYPYYGVPYAGGGYAGPTPGGAVSATPGGPSGGIRIQDAPRNTEVYVDGQHVGVVEDFDGTFQHLSLAPGAHRIELRAQGYETLMFDAHIDPGQTVNYRAHMRRQQ